MKKLILSIGICFLLFSCSREETLWEVDESPANTVSHEMIVLGKQLEDPYSVQNMERALASIYPSKGDRYDVTATDRYIRFLPADEHEYNQLLESGLVLLDHPLDYQIVKDGDYYHDPSISDGQITWQYAVVSKEASFPEGIRHEILDDCFIPEHDVRTRSDGLDWERVVRESYILTGNENQLLPLTRSGSYHPTGRITIEDEQFAGGKPIGVAGVKVVCHSFVKFSSCYTDRDGKYTIPKTYTSRIRYRLMFKNQLNFSIGLNLILVPASSSALGRGCPAGIDVHIRPDSNRNLFCRSVVNNAIYDFITKTRDGQMGISDLPESMRIWIMQKTDNSSAVMMHHGTVVDYSLLKRYVGEYAALLKVFLPDITIGAKNLDSYADLYKLALHECAHAAHFKKVGVDYWNHYSSYVLNSFLHQGTTYGDGEGDDAGYCEIGEMWAYFMENIMSRERYGQKLPDSGHYFWFHPQIFYYLHNRCMSVPEIFQALTPDVTDLDALRRKLISFYPDRALVIRQIFDRYLF